MHVCRCWIWKARRDLRSQTLAWDLGYTSVVNLVLLLSKKVCIRFFVSHSLSLGAVRPTHRCLDLLQEVVWISSISTTITMTSSSPASPSLLLALSTSKCPTGMGLQWQGQLFWAALSCLTLVHLPPSSILLSQVHSITSLFVLSLGICLCLAMTPPAMPSPPHFQKTQPS